MRFIYLTAAIFFIFVSNAHSYVGPGLGLGAIGAVVGFLVAILTAVIGIFWYPIKRLLKKKKAGKEMSET
jgi:hypothetical protein